MKRLKVFCSSDWFLIGIAVLILTMGSLAQPISAQNCQLSNLNEGLISALSTTGSSIGNRSQTCVLNTSQAIYRDFNVPSYQDLENQFYTLSRSSAKKTTPLSSNAGWAFTGQSAGNGIYLQTTSVTLPSASGAGNQIVFIRGDLNIVGDIAYADTDPNSGLVFITSGDINISSEVIKVNAVLISYGKICTAYNTITSSCLTGTTPTPPLTINGSLISLNKTPLTSGQSALLMKRNLVSNVTAAETINKQSKYLYNLRGGLLTKDLILIQEDKNYPIPTDTPIVIPPPPPPPASQLTQGLVAHWKMNETSWTGVDGEIKDSSTTGVHARKYNQTTTVAPGRFDERAAIFDGSEDYITAPDNPALEFGSSDFSISTWVFLNNYPIGQLGQSIYAKDSGLAVPAPLALVIRTGTNGNIHAWMSAASTWSVMNDINLGGAGQLTLNAWHHVVFQRSAGLCKLYIDGSVTSATQNGIACSGTLQDNAHTHYLGGHFQGAQSGSTDSINGKMDDFRIYKRALSTAEISALNTNTALIAVPLSIPNLALWLDAEDSSTITHGSGLAVSRWDDLSGNNRHFTQSTASRQPAYNQNVQNGKPAIRFSAGNTQSLANTFNLGTPNTIFYVSRMTPGGTARQRILASIADNWLLGYWGSFMKQAFFNGWIAGNGSTGTAADTNWHVYSGTQTGSASSVYDNGSTLVTNSTAGVSGPNGLRIGCWLEVNECSDADVAEVIAYNRVLSGPELQKVADYLYSKWAIVPDPGPITLTPGLTAYWKLDETSGSTLANSVNSSAPGTAAGTSVLTPGKLGPAARTFPGTPNYITSAQPITATTTISAWAKSTNSQGMLWRTGPDGVGPDLFFYNGKISLNSWDSDANSFCSIPATAGNGLWHNYVTVISPASTSLYYDGTLCGNATYKNPQSTNFTISSGAGYDWNGSIDEVGVWNKALTAQEIAQIYNSGAGVSYPFTPASQFNPNTTGTLSNSLISYWNMNEPSGTTLEDIKNDNNGTTNATVSTSGNVKGNARILNSSTGAINISNPNNFTNQNFTFSGWVKPTSFTGWSSIFNVRSSTDNRGIVLEFIQSDSGRLQIQMDGAGTFSSTNKIPLNQWTMVTLSYDHSNIKFYINGALDKSQAATGNVNFPGSPSAVLGRNIYDTSPASILNGLLDEAGYWGRALSGTGAGQNCNTNPNNEICNLYNSGLGNTYTP